MMVIADFHQVGRIEPMVRGQCNAGNYDLTSFRTNPTIGKRLMHFYNESSYRMNSDRINQTNDKRQV
jgi:hypothetical protein